MSSTLQNNGYLDSMDVALTPTLPSDDLLKEIISPVYDDSWVRQSDFVHIENLVETGKEMEVKKLMLKEHTAAASQFHTARAIADAAPVEVHDESDVLGGMSRKLDPILQGMEWQAQFLQQYKERNLSKDKAVASDYKRAMMESYRRRQLQSRPESKYKEGKRSKKDMPHALCPDLQRALNAHRSTKKFDAIKWIENKCQKLNDYMSVNGLKACITNVSGGIDSAVVLALCARAMQSAGSPILKNIGVCQPICSSEWALARGKESIAVFNAVEVIIDQTPIYTQLSQLVERAVGIEGKDFARGQLRSYMRTPSVYYAAQLLSQGGTPAIVMGTGNKDEDYYLGYFCKAGDGVVDVQTISDLHKSEVFIVAEVLGVPESTRQAQPSADLWNGQLDEDELGFPYDFVELFTSWYMEQDEQSQLQFLSTLSPEAYQQFEEYSKACKEVHRRNAHKLQGIVQL